MVWNSRYNEEHAMMIGEENEKISSKSIGKYLEFGKKMHEKSHYLAAAL